MDVFTDSSERADMNWLSDQAASESLSLTDRQIRRHAETGELEAQQVGARWLIDADSVRSRSRIEIHAGRPLSAEMCWSLMAIVDAQLLGHHPHDRNAAIDDRRRRHRVRQLLENAPDPQRWDFWMRRRAERSTVWVHPGVLNDVLTDRRVHVSGTTALAAAGLAVSGETGHCVYVSQRDIEASRNEYRAVPSTDGQVVTMVVPTALNVLGADGSPVGPCTALIDLLSSTDARLSHMAATTLQDAVHDVGAALEAATSALE
jgi:hypothetical protein